MSERFYQTLIREAECSPDQKLENSKRYGWIVLIILFAVLLLMIVTSGCAAGARLSPEQTLKESIR